MGGFSMGGLGSGRHSEHLVSRQDPLPAVTITELQKHHVFTCEETVPFANHTSPGDLIRPDKILGGQAQRVGDRVVFGFLVGTYGMLVAELKDRALKDRASQEDSPSKESNLSEKSKLSKESKPRFLTVSVGLSWSACNYGGERPWLLCPGRSEGPSEASEGPSEASERSCGRRVSKLYLDGPWLICRHCLGWGTEAIIPWKGLAVCIDRRRSGRV